ncbi:MAG: TRAM domain-containing protein [Candidatus Bathyarchaeia archaeon]
MSRRPFRRSRPFTPTRRDFGAPKPVREGDELDVTIEAIGTKGDGIARVQGFIVFVPGTTTGDRLKIRVATVRPNFAVAEAIGEAEEAAVEEEE